jgi:large subunit ribosomal protein L1
MKQGKRYEAAASKVDSAAVYELEAAVKLVKELATAKFDETIELSAQLSVDPRQADQQVRGTVVLPHATPDLMGEVGKLGRTLGPRGLMPNPKSGTVTFDVAKAVRDVKAGKVEYRVDKNANLHIPIGKRSFEEGALLENLKVLIHEIVRAKPASSKGKYIKSMSISSTMGPSVKLDSAAIGAAH